MKSMIGSTHLTNAAESALGERGCLARGTAGDDGLHVFDVTLILGSFPVWERGGATTGIEQTKDAKTG